MPTIRHLDSLIAFAMPLTCSLLALAAAILLPVLNRRVNDRRQRVLWLLAAVALFFAAWHGLNRFHTASRWLMPLSSPVVAIYLLVILPALLLPRGGRWRRWYLLLPAGLVLMMPLAVLDAYRSVPDAERGFHWFLIRPVWLLAGMASLLVLLQPLLSLRRFRFAVRSTCFIVLVYGGFMFRKDYGDWKDALERRREPADVMMISETVPVMSHDWRMLHLPSAPCRFTADGGYVQGCNLELFQRLFQLDFGKVARREENALATASVIAGALTLFLALTFIAGRWMCGWLCPLSALGDIADWIRRKLGLPHLKPATPVKLACLASGLSLSGITLAMAKAVPHLDESGRFLGCKIPLYPFCKICPSQQLCPVAAGGLSAYPGLPNWAWGGGFFFTFCLALLAFFGFCFATSRRLWCRFCPMGMISGVFNRGGACRLVKDSGKCNRCGVCAEVCPMDIDFVRAEMKQRDVSSYDCVLCLKCVEKCPKDGCLALEHAGARVTESRFNGGEGN